MPPVGDISSLPISDTPPPVLKYNVGEKAQAIEYWLQLIFEGKSPHAGTGWGTIIIEAENFRIADVNGTVRRRFPPTTQKG
jgi:hypothetical protein